MENLRLIQCQKILAALFFTDIGDFSRWIYLIRDMILQVLQEQFETTLYPFFPNSFFVPFMLCKVEKWEMGWHAVPSLPCAPTIALCVTMSTQVFNGKCSKINLERSVSHEGRCSKWWRSAANYLPRCCLFCFTSLTVPSWGHALQKHRSAACTLIIILYAS